MSQCVKVIVSQAWGPVFKFLSSMQKSVCRYIYQQPQWWQWWRWKWQPTRACWMQVNGSFKNIIRRVVEEVPGAQLWHLHVYVLRSAMTYTHINTPHTYSTYTPQICRSHVCKYTHPDKHTNMSHTCINTCIHTYMYHMYSYILKGDEGNCGDVKENGLPQ